MSIKKKIKEINKIGKEVSKDDLAIALFMVLQRQTHEYETLRLTKHQLLEIVRTVNKL